jgi:hypothetical protein
MTWETPSITEIDMNAEIGAYQEDDGGNPYEPIVSAETPSAE